MENSFLRKRRLQKFKLNSNAYLLDLGCGEGITITALKQMGINKIVGVDISQEQLDEAKKRNPEITFIKASSEKLPFKNKQFEVVLVSSMFHHLHGYKKTLQEIRRVLIANGYLCFIEPANTPGRFMLDYLTQNSFTKIFPIFKERNLSYKDESTTMQQWLKNKNEFLRLLKAESFKKVFLKKDFMSIIGKYHG